MQFMLSFVQARAPSGQHIMTFATTYGQAFVHREEPRRKELAQAGCL